MQQLSILLEDAGIPADALAKGMKELQREIATGGVELQKFGTMIGAANMVPDGYAYGRTLAAKYPDDIAVFRTLARTVLSTPAVRERDLDFAMEMAVRANEIGKDEDPRAADALALAWFSKGDREKAVEHQKRAIALQKDVKVRKNYEATLRKYETQEPGPVPPGGTGPRMGQRRYLHQWFHRRHPGFGR